MLGWDPVEESKYRDRSISNVLPPSILTKAGCRSTHSEEVESLKSLARNNCDKLHLTDESNF